MRVASGVPEITVAVPTIDRPAMLQRAVGSVLSQAYQNLEVVISDNASLSDMSPVAQGFGDRRVRFQRHETRLSMAQNWNSCLDAAKGKYFLLLSDDDVLCPDAIESLMASFHADGGTSDLRTGFCYGRTIVVDSEDRILWRSFRGVREESALAFYRGLLAHRRALYPCATLFHTADLRALGGYDGHRFGAAVDLGAALGAAFELGRVRYVDREVCRYTEHAANLTGQINITDWSRTLREIEAMVETHVHPTRALRAALHRSVDSFIAYFVMDVAGKRAMASGSGVIRAWLAADHARRFVVSAPTLGARLRAAAKLTYLRVRLLARSKANRR